MLSHFLVGILLAASSPHPTAVGYVTYELGATTPYSINISQRDIVGVHFPFPCRGYSQGGFLVHRPLVESAPNPGSFDATPASKDNDSKPHPIAMIWLDSSNPPAIGTTATVTMTCFIDTGRGTTAPLLVPLMLRAASDEERTSSVTFVWPQDEKKMFSSSITSVRLEEKSACTIQLNKEEQSRIKMRDQAMLQSMLTAFAIEKKSQRASIKDFAVLVDAVHRIGQKAGITFRVFNRRSTPLYLKEITIESKGASFRISRNISASVGQQQAESYVDDLVGSVANDAELAPELTVILTPALNPGAENNGGVLFDFPWPPDAAGSVTLTVTSLDGGHVVEEIDFPRGSRG